MIIATLVAVAVVAAVGAAPASAHGIWCAPDRSVGGVKAPVVTSSGVSGGGLGGYRCSFKWTVETVAEFERAGRWHVASFRDARSGGMFRRGEAHVWTPPSTVYPDACHFNWREHSYFAWRGRILAVQTTSKVTRRTC